MINLFDEKKCLIGFCLNKNIKVLFNNALIHSNVDKNILNGYDCLFNNLFENNNIIKILHATVGNNDDTLPPYFMSRCHLIYLTFIGIICINDYGATHGSDYSMSIHHSAWSSSEIFIALMLFSSILHEIGEIWDAHWSWKLYVEDEWNIMDTMSYVLGVLWWSEN
jgi:hypothetical protein